MSPNKNWKQRCLTSNQALQHCYNLIRGVWQGLPAGLTWMRGPDILSKKLLVNLAVSAPQVLLTTPSEQCWKKIKQLEVVSVLKQCLHKTSNTCSKTLLGQVLLNQNPCRLGQIFTNTGGLNHNDDVTLANTFSIIIFFHSTNGLAYVMPSSWFEPPMSVNIWPLLYASWF